MDKDIEAAFAGIMVVLGEITQTMEQRFAALDSRLDAFATKAQLDAMMARMNDGFERVLLSGRSGG